MSRRRRFVVGFGVSRGDGDGANETCTDGFSDVCYGVFDFTVFLRPKVSGLPFCAMHAFSRAIAPGVFPRNCWWSRSTFVIAEAMMTSSGRAFVASNLPLNPTSNMAISTPARSNICAAVAVKTSKGVAPMFSRSLIASISVRTGLG